jgi:ArsR family transcriptional regulator
MKTDEVAAAMDALGHEARLGILRALVRAGEAGLTVAEIQQRLGGMPRSTLTHHMQKLVMAQLVLQEKVSASVVTRANYDVMRSVLTYLSDECCIEEDARLPERSGVS